MKTVVILGATGSIGTSALDVIRANPREFRVVGLAAGHPSDKLAALAREFPGAKVAVADETPALVRESDADTCIAGISGTAGLRPTFAAAEKGMRILLANKEVMVSAGKLFNAAVRKGGATVLPLDSEHAALWQCLEGKDPATVAKVWITASGGPFRTWSEERMAAATPADAVKHPKWNMGAKISVDSATLANKVLEVIEAHMLFDIPVGKIGILVHPQSAVHGIIEFTDGGHIAHMGICDMRQPISYMLFHPKRLTNRLPRFDLLKLGRLDFEAPDANRFPLLNIGLDAARQGGGYPALFNAANETAVELFLDGKLTFVQIVVAVADAMRINMAHEPATLDDIAAIHSEAAHRVRAYAYAAAR